MQFKPNCVMACVTCVTFRLLHSPSSSHFAYESYYKLNGMALIQVNSHKDSEVAKSSKFHGVIIYQEVR